VPRFIPDITIHTIGYEKIHIKPVSLYPPETNKYAYSSVKIESKKLSENLVFFVLCNASKLSNNSKVTRQ